MMMMASKVVSISLLFLLNVSFSKAFLSFINLSSKKYSTLFHVASSDEAFYRDFQNAADKLQVESIRHQLEEQNTLSFLRRKPRKLPYEDARRWVQANLGCATKEEFYDLVANGNVRTPYIPKQPEQYYTQTREWISWEHFLTGIFDQANPSAVGPATGVFD